MLTIGLSVSSRIKLLERSLMMHVRSISSTLQAMSLREKASITAEASAEATLDLSITSRPTALRVAKTTMPEKRYSYNDTFQHIRSELDVLYKESNPIFDNITSSPEGHDAAGEPEHECQLQLSAGGVGSTLGMAAEKTKVVYGGADTPALWISKTVMPEERLDFNETFRHIRAELDEFYKERNALFDNTIEAVESTDRKQSAKADDKLVSAHKAVATKKTPAIKKLQESVIMPEPEARVVANMALTKSYSSKSAQSSREAFSSNWVGIPAMAEL